MAAPADPGPAGARFDRIVVVDWSASSTPRLGRDSIWIAVVDDGGTNVENLPTRREAERRLVALVADAGGRRTLLGVDFSLGYPAGTTVALGLPGTPWRAMWRHLAAVVDDDEGNRNNRFAVAGELNRRLGRRDGPFWGRPPGRVVDGLPATKPRPTPDGGDRASEASAPAPVPGEWRAAEVALRTAGYRPFSAWQLLGAGCVGSQTLVGIPVLERLRVRLGGHVHVWPFTTGLAVPDVRPGDTVVAEVWPTLVDVEPTLGRVRDAVQVETLAVALAGLDRTAELDAWFAPAIDDRTAADVVAEEGWVLGAGSPVVAFPPALAGAGRSDAGSRQLVVGG